VAGRGQMAGKPYSMNLLFNHTAERMGRTYRPKYTFIFRVMDLVEIILAFFN
jgi:hypothetical protein